MPTVNDCHKLHKQAQHDAQMTKLMYEATLAHFDTTLTNLEKQPTQIISTSKVPEEEPKVEKKDAHRLTGLVRFLQSSS